MSKKIKQIIKTQEELRAAYYANTVISVLENEKVTMLGMQAAPGTQFRINNGGIIEMGFYGIYELNLEHIGGAITSIVLVAPSPEFGSKDTSIIIDIIYEDGGVLV